jgi:exodeoxyribonuclease VII small subunit
MVPLCRRSGLAGAVGSRKHLGPMSSAPFNPNAPNTPAGSGASPVGAGSPGAAASPSPPSPDERFDELLARLRGLVEKLEGGNLPLEDGLRCFEEGMTLCKRGAEILDRAERRVEVLLGSGAEGARTAPFDTSTSARDDHG